MVVRLPRATVAPLIGAPPAAAVTVPCKEPSETVVQEGNLKDPMRVWSFKPVVA